VPSVLFRDTPEGREWMKEHEGSASQDE
jgi:hypothetical protein